MEGSALLYVTTLPDLVATGIVIVETKCFSFITRSCDHMFKRLCDLMG